MILAGACDIDRFWILSYYDLTLLLKKISEDARKEREKEERFFNSIESSVRNLYVLIYNFLNRSDKKASEIWPIGEERQTVESKAEDIQKRREIARRHLEKYKERYQ